MNQLFTSVGMRHWLFVRIGVGACLIGKNGLWLPIPKSEPIRHPPLSLV